MSKSILEKNLEAMEKWYPAFADLIDVPAGAIRNVNVSLPLYFLPFN